MDRRFTLELLCGVRWTEPVFKKTLRRALFSDVPDLALSDLLPAGFLYRPMLLELARPEGREQHSAYKQIKSAQYIQRALLADYPTGDTLLYAMTVGAVRRCGDRLAASGEAVGSLLRREIEDSVPVLRAEKGDRSTFTARSRTRTRTCCAWATSDRSARHGSL